MNVKGGPLSGDRSQITNEDTFVILEKSGLKYPSTILEEL